MDSTLKLFTILASFGTSYQIGAERRMGGVSGLRKEGTSIAWVKIGYIRSLKERSVFFHMIGDYVNEEAL